MKLEAADSFEGSVRRLVGSRLRRADGLAKATARGEVEAVHDMRTGLRRIRTLLGLLEGKRAKRLRKAAKRFARELGAVRDLDVAIERVGHSVGRGELSLDSGVAAWLHALERERKEARRTLRKTLRSAAYRSWRRRVRAWTKHEAFGLAVHEGLPPALRTLVEEVDTLIDPHDETAKHELRKACKRLRYVLELYEAVLPIEAAEVAKAMNDAQDALGEHRDRLVLAQRAEEEAEASATMGEDPRELLAYARRLRGGLGADGAVTIATKALAAAHRLVDEPFISGRLSPTA